MVHQNKALLKTATYGAFSNPKTWHNVGAVLVDSPLIADDYNWRWRALLSLDYDARVESIEALSEASFTACDYFGN